MDGENDVEFDSVVDSDCVEGVKEEEEGEEEEDEEEGEVSVLSLDEVAFVESERKVVVLGDAS